MQHKYCIAKSGRQRRFGERRIGRACLNSRESLENFPVGMDGVRQAKVERAELAAAIV